MDHLPESSKKTHSPSPSHLFIWALSFIEMCVFCCHKWPFQLRKGGITCLLQVDTFIYPHQRLHLHKYKVGSAFAIGTALILFDTNSRCWKQQMFVCTDMIASCSYSIFFGCTSMMGISGPLKLNWDLRTVEAIW